MKFLKLLFHQHKWKLVSADISTKLCGFAATATLECEICGRRDFFMKGAEILETQFPSRGAAKAWIESLLPADHAEIVWKKGNN